MNSRPFIKEWLMAVLSLTPALYQFLCQPSLVRYLLVSSGNRPSNMIAKWFNASFQ